ncbi:MAG: hypothetical protein A3E01_15255 [Gammaproteobacteria bacterium RIFCSPHIGHO2_12_FULL_63_22]|nr:MAG: hypothetical protein A3E01_15255 [Gammaproteobacteria bacterium RIFCSPHIGHO2_12_FULL_63_22]
MTPATLTRRERLLVAIWDAWKDGRAIRYTDMIAASGFVSRSGLWSTLAILVRQGWLRKSVVEHYHWIDAQKSHKYLPGPRFGGIDRKTGRPLYIIQGADQFRAPAMRAPKYDRRRELFVAARRLGA